MNGNVQHILDLSPLQSGILFTVLRSMNHGAYVNRVIMELEGTVDHVRLEEALNRLVERHDALRTAFVSENVDRPVQVVLKQRRIRLERRAANDREPAPAKPLAFDLEREPLLRCALVERDGRRCDLVLTYHHIALDGWCLRTLSRELWAEYFADADARPTERPLSYSHYLGWLKQQDQTASKRYWQDYLANYRPAHSAPFLAGAAESSSYIEQEHRLRLDAARTRTLDQVAQQLGVTRNAVAQTAWGLLLQRYGHADDVVFSHVVSTRPPELPGIESAVGLFINTLPVRVRQLEGDTFASVIKRLQQDVVDGTRHGALSWGEMTAGVPLADLEDATLHVYANENNPEDAVLRFPGRDLRLLAVRTSGRTHYRFNVIVTGTKQLEFAFKYNAALIPAQRVERLARHLEIVLDAIAGNPGQSVSQLSLVRDVPRRMPPAARPPHPRGATLHGKFIQQAQEFPDKVAISFGETADRGQVTYAALDRQSSAIARLLRAAGAAGQIVALMMDRHPDAIAGMLGVLKAGSAYLPIDPRTPAERIEFLLRDSQARTLLTTRRLPLAGAKFDGTVLHVEDADETAPVLADADGDDLALAYVIYTSGSTGRPKGVMIEHRHVTRLFRECDSWFRFTSDDVWSVFHSFGFDFSVWEIWGALLHGGRMHLMSHAETRDPQRIWALLERERVTMLSQTPSAFYPLLEAVEAGAVEPARFQLRHVVFGGEALSVPRVAPWIRLFGDECPHLVNMYGITETTVHVTYRRILAADLDSGARSPIGRAIPDLQTWVLDRNGNPAAPGAIGEIYVGGAGVARGYLNRPELTAERIGDVNALGRLYRTGDLAEVREDGELEYLGRADEQVKIRGHRIELGEIEFAARHHPGVRDALARLAPDARGERILQVCYVASTEIAPSDLRATLERSLPDYMLPASIARVAAVPLTASGKIDRRSSLLPEPTVAGGEGRAPRNAVEEALAEIWRLCLGAETIGIDSNFFALGGDSIKTLQLRARAAKLGLHFSIEDLLSNPTIRQLAAAIGNAAAPLPAMDEPRPFALINSQERQALPASVVDAYPLSALQAGMLFHTEAEPSAGMYHDIGSWCLNLRFDESRFRAAVEQLAARHPVLRTSFALTGFNRVLQLVHGRVDIPIEIVDWRDRPEPAAAIAAWVEAEKARPFDPVVAPLVRFRVQRLGEQRFQLNLTLHHAVLDGWSLALLLTELLETYLAPADAPPRAAIATQFRDFIALEQEATDSESSRRFWLERLEGVDALTFRDLPARFRDEVSGEAACLKIGVNRNVETRLRVIAREHGLPFKALLLATHLKVLGVFSGRPDVVTGIVSNGRPETDDADRALGLFLNTLPLRMALGGESWLELAKRVAQEEIAAFPHRRYPLARLQRELGVRPLFEASFNYVHFHAYEKAHALVPQAFESGSFFEHTNHALSENWVVDAHSGELAVLVRYDAHRFSAAQVGILARLTTAALARFADAPHASHNAGPLLPGDEVERLRVFGQGGNRVPGGTVLDGFRTTVATRPDAIAATDGVRTITYRELNRRSATFAENLRQRHLVAAGEIVGVRMNRSIELLVALLGILRTGAAYVPLQKDLPPERLTVIATDCALDLILTDEVEPPAGFTGAIAFVGDGKVLKELGSSDDDQPGGLAYVIYTSGSTGRPKGCAVEHRSLCNYVAWAAEQYTDADVRTWAFHSSLSYDLTVTSIFVPLVTGRSIRIYSEGGASALEQALDDDTADVIKLTPSHLRLVKALGRGRSRWRKIIAGGEELDRALAEAIVALHDGRVTLYNEYGPTEATVGCMIHAWAASDDTHGTPIGRPIWNTAIRVLAPERALVPIGVTGELAIGGAGVARGYLNRVELTHARFVQGTPADRGERVYITGDLARWLPDGIVEFWGRNDDQVKINGHRVELAEIEFCLRSCQGVDETVVLLVDGGLHAFWRGASEEGDVLAFARRQLPGHMVPRSFQRVAEFPIGSSGKVDRARLRGIYRAPCKPVDAMPPASAQEEAVLAIWREVLGNDEIGSDSRFLSVGGDSIAALQISARLKARGYRVGQEAVLSNLTVREQAAAITAAQDDHLDEPIGVIAAPPIHRWFAEQPFPFPEHWNNSIVVAAPDRFDLSALYASLDALFEHHDGLRLVRSARDELVVHASDRCTYTIESFDLRSDPEPATAIEAQANRLQGGLVLTEPPLARFALFHTVDRDHLLILFHHMVVDGVSWRVIVQDFVSGYHMAREGNDIRLPAKTASYRCWAEHLAHYAATTAARAELPYWLGVCQADVVSTAGGARRGSEYERENLCLTTEQTAQLCSSAVHEAYRTDVQDVLMAALAAALRETLLGATGRRAGQRIRITMENHGRGHLPAGIDVSRTVGWFTCFFPFLLELHEEPLEPTLVRVKEALRAVPHAGAGYGTLRYLTPLSAEERAALTVDADIIFNFWGNMERGIATAGFERSIYSAGLNSSPRNPAPFALSITGSIVDERLQMAFGFDPAVFAPALVQRLVQTFAARLHELITVTTRAEMSVTTPSDFELEGLNAADLELIRQRKA